MSDEPEDLTAGELDDIAPLLEGAVQSGMRAFHRYCDREDLRQELVCWALAHPETVREGLAGETRALERAMANEARRYGEKEKAAVSGYEPQDVFYWQRAAIEEMLPLLWDDEARVNPVHGGGEGNQTRRDPAEGGNWLATLADLGRAFESLNPRQKWMVESYYRFGMKQDEIAALDSDDQGHPVSQSTVSEHIARAIKKMHHSLGGSRPKGHYDCECTGRRTIFTNARALSETSAQWDGN